MKSQVMPPMNLQYADEKDVDELSTLYVDVWKSENIELFQLLRFYFYLYNKRIECSGTSFPITDTRMWPHINYTCSAIKKLIYEQNAQEIEDCKKYLLSVFAKENDKYLREVNDTFFILCKEITGAQVYKLKYESNVELRQRNNTLDFGLQWNDLAFTQEMIEIRTYEVSYLKCYQEELKRENRRNRINVSLTVVGTIATLVGIIISLLPLFL